MKEQQYPWHGGGGVMRHNTSPVDRQMVRNIVALLHQLEHETHRTRKPAELRQLRRRFAEAVVELCTVINSRWGRFNQITGRERKQFAAALLNGTTGSKEMLAFLAGMHLGSWVHAFIVDRRLKFAKDQISLQFKTRVRLQEKREERRPKDVARWRKAMLAYDAALAKYGKKGLAVKAAMEAAQCSDKSVQNWRTKIWPTLRDGEIGG